MLWIPPVIDMVNGRNNFANIVGFFTDGEEKPHTWLQGWGAVTGQFAWPPEWLTDQNGPFWSGEETYMYTRPLPVLLGLVALAGVVLWRRGGEAGRRLVVTLGATLLLGIVRRRPHGRLRVLLPAAVAVDRARGGVRRRRLGGLGADRTPLAAGRPTRADGPVARGRWPCSPGST